MELETGEGDMERCTTIGGTKFLCSSVTDEWDTLRGKFHVKIMCAIYNVFLFQKTTVTIEMRSFYNITILVQ